VSVHQGRTFGHEGRKKERRKEGREGTRRKKEGKKERRIRRGVAEKCHKRRTE
jgi:hypothetical protein